MKYLSPVELDTMLKGICSGVSNSFYPYSVMFDTMYQTGARYHEVQDVTRWQMLHSNLYQLTTAKGGEIRQFQANEIPLQYRQYITWNVKECTSHGYRTIVRTFYAFSKYRILYVGDKPCSLHLFRHNYVKRLLAIGLTPYQIQQKLGHVDMKNTMKYVDSTINY